MRSDSSPFSPLTNVVACAVSAHQIRHVAIASTEDSACYNPKSYGALLREGQTNGESGAFTRSAVDLDRAVVVLNDFLGDIEAQPGAVL